MKIHNGGAILTGLAVFVILALFPIWYNALSEQSSAATALEGLREMTGDAKCLEDAQFMRANHMTLLNEWRDLVVRENERFYTKDGERIERSLTNTCRQCHVNTAKMLEAQTAIKGQAMHCNVCHEYVGVEIYCWDCHNDAVNVTTEVK